MLGAALIFEMADDCALFCATAGRDAADAYDQRIRNTVTLYLV